MWTCRYCQRPIFMHNSETQRERGPQSEMRGFWSHHKTLGGRGRGELFWHPTEVGVGVVQRTLGSSYPQDEPQEGLHLGTVKDRVWQPWAAPETYHQDFPVTSPDWGGSDSPKKGEGMETPASPRTSNQQILQESLLKVFHLFHPNTEAQTSIDYYH